HHCDREHKSRLGYTARECKEHRKQRERTRHKAGNKPNRQTLAMRMPAPAQGTQDQPESDRDQQTPTETFEGGCTPHPAERPREERAASSASTTADPTCVRA